MYLLLEESVDVKSRVILCLLRNIRILSPQNLRHDVSGPIDQVSVLEQCVGLLFRCDGVHEAAQVEKGNTLRVECDL